MPPPAAEGVTPEIVDAARATAWFTAEHAVLLAAVALAGSTGLDAVIAPLAWTLVDFFDRQGHWEDWAATQSAALDAVRRLANPAGEAVAHRGIARACARLGRSEDAPAARA